MNEAPWATIEALMYELREYGLSQLRNPNCLRRLDMLSSNQMRDVIRRLLGLRDCYPKVTDELLIKLGDLLL